jgi:hypothetical protein
VGRGGEGRGGEGRGGAGGVREEAEAATRVARRQSLYDSLRVGILYLEFNGRLVFSLVLVFADAYMWFHLEDP